MPSPKLGSGRPHVYKSGYGFRILPCRARCPLTVLAFQSIKGRGSSLLEEAYKALHRGARFTQIVSHRQRPFEGAKTCSLPFASTSREPKHRRSASLLRKVDCKTAAQAEIEPPIIALLPGAGRFSGQIPIVTPSRPNGFMYSGSHALFRDDIEKRRRLSQGTQRRPPESTVNNAVPRGVGGKVQQYDTIFLGHLICRTRTEVEAARNQTSDELTNQ